MNNNLMTTIVKALFYLLAAVLLVWTASMTLAFVGVALPNLPVAKFFALAIFDAGAVAWLLIFIYAAEGISQRAIALMLAIFDLLGVGLMVMAELLTGGQTIVQVSTELGMVALYGIGIWTFVNLVGVFVYHMSDVETLHRIAQRNAADKITNRSLKMLDARTDEIADEVADQLASRMVGETLLKLSATSERYSRAAIGTGRDGSQGEETADFFREE